VGVVMHKYALTLRKANKYDLMSLNKHREDNNSNGFQIIEDDQNASQLHSLILVGIDQDDIETPSCSWQMKAVGYVLFTDINHVTRTANITFDTYKHSQYQNVGSKLLSSGSDYGHYILGLRKLSCEVPENDVAIKRILDRSDLVLEGIRKSHMLTKYGYVDSHVYTRSFT